MLRTSATNAAGALPCHQRPAVLPIQASGARSGAPIRPAVAVISPSTAPAVSSDSRCTGRLGARDTARQVQRLRQRPALQRRRVEATLSRLVDRDETDQPGEVGRREEGHRVHVAVAHPQPEMEHTGVLVDPTTGRTDDVHRGRPAARAAPRSRRGTSTTCAARPAWAITTCSDPATLPAKETSPAFAARTGVPPGASRSAPRWPAP